MRLRITHAMGTLVSVYAPTGVSEGSFGHLSQGYTLIVPSGFNATIGNGYEIAMSHILPEATVPVDAHAIREFITLRDSVGLDADNRVTTPLVTLLTLSRHPDIKTELLCFVALFREG